MVRCDVPAAQELYSRFERLTHPEAPACAILERYGRRLRALNRAAVDAQLLDAYAPLATHSDGPLSPGGSHAPSMSALSARVCPPRSGSASPTPAAFLAGP